MENLPCYHQFHLWLKTFSVQELRHNPGVTLSIRCGSS
jgi:hypothetical protein